MARALGIDPGTRSFDLVVVDGPRAVWERSIDTVDVAEDPRKLLDAIEKAAEMAEIEDYERRDYIKLY